MDKKKKKTAKQLERYFKGVANHRRIEILKLIADSGAISLEDLASSVRGNIKTISEHSKKLVQAGLVNKQYYGRKIMHTLSPYGSKFYKFITTF